MPTEEVTIDFKGVDRNLLSMVEKIAKKAEGNDKILALGILAVHLEAVEVIRALKRLTDAATFTKKRK